MVSHGYKYVYNQVSTHMIAHTGIYIERIELIYRLMSWGQSTGQDPIYMPQGPFADTASPPADTRRAMVTAHEVWIADDKVCSTN